MIKITWKTSIKDAIKEEIEQKWEDFFSGLTKLVTNKSILIYINNKLSIVVSIILKYLV